MVLPKIQITHIAAMNDLRLAAGDDAQNVQTSKLAQQECLLSEASFGVEHIFREIGQVYESFVFSRLGKEHF